MIDTKPSSACLSQMQSSSHKTDHIVASSGFIKEKVEFWEEVKNNLWALSLLLCKCGRTSEKKCSLKAWLFKWFHMWPGTTKPPKSRKKLFSWFHPIMKEEVLLIKMVYYLSKLKLPNPFNLVNEKSWWGRLLVLNCEKESFKVWGYSSMRSKQTTGKSIEGWIKRP